jgi:signal transduction histidine kinase
VEDPWAKYKFRLAIAQRLVERLDGELQLNSQKGQGTTVQFTLRKPVLAQTKEGDNS